jgi:hypothetical protein
MNRRFLIHVFLILFLATGTAAFAASAAEPSARPLRSPDALPEPVLYGQMFLHVVALEQRAAALEKRGEDGSQLRLRYKQSAELSDREDETLKTIARDCMARVTEQDRKAMEVIRAVRARTPDGQLARGEKAPVPQAELAELAALQAERDALILAARDRLRATFGEEEFVRLDAFARKTLGPHIRQIAPGIQRPDRRGQK